MAYIFNDYYRIGKATMTGDFNICVKIEAGEEREVDVSCDSEFMKYVMKRVRDAIQEAYYWVEED